MSDLRVTYRDDGLPGHPAYRQRPVPSAVWVSAHRRDGGGGGGGGREGVDGGAEVAELDGEGVVDETAGCRQSAVDDAAGLDVLHRGRYLRRHEDQTAVAAHKRAEISPLNSVKKKHRDRQKLKCNIYLHSPQKQRMHTLLNTQENSLYLHFSRAVISDIIVFVFVLSVLVQLAH